MHGISKAFSTYLVNVKSCDYLVKSDVEKLVGRSFKSLLSGTLLIAWHFGHLKVSRPWLVVCFKHCRQKVCRHGMCFGSVYTLVHTGQETSSRRLWSNVLISMCFFTNNGTYAWLNYFSRNWTRDNEAVWLSYFSYSGKKLFLLTAGFLYKPITKRCLS